MYFTRGLGVVDLITNGFQGGNNFLQEGLSAIGTSITDEVLTALGMFVSHPFILVINAVDKATINAIKPGWDAWNKAFSLTGSPTAFEDMMEAMRIVGAAVTLILAIIGIILYFIKANHDSKASPFTLIIRIVLAAILILESSNITKTINDFWGEVYPYVVKTTMTLNGQQGPLARFADSTLTGDSLSVGGMALVQKSQDGEINPLWYWSGLLIFIILWPLLKEFLRLALEIFERYLVLCIMMIFFPLAACMVTLDETSGVFTSFMKMTIGQFALLVISNSFLFLTSQLIYAVAAADEFAEFVFLYLFTLAFARASQKVDGYMNSMGFNVARTGLDLAGAFRGAGMGLLMAAKTAAGAARGIKNVTGEGLKAIGAATGNRNIFAAGQAVSSIGSIGKGKSVPTSFDSDMAFMKAAGASGKTPTISGKNAGIMMERYMANSRGNASIAELSNESKAAGVANILQRNNNQLANGISDISNVNFNEKAKSISFTGIDENGVERGYTLSTQDNNLGMSVGNGVYLNANSNMSIEGDYTAGSAHEVAAATGALQVGINNDSIRSAEITGNDMVYSDDSGSVVGRIDGYGNDNARFYNADNNIESRSNQILDNVKNAYHLDSIDEIHEEPNSPGRYYAHGVKDGDMYKIQINDIGAAGRQYGDNVAQIKTSPVYLTRDSSGNTHSYRYSYGIATERVKVDEGNKPPRVAPPKKNSSNRKRA